MVLDGLRNVFLAADTGSVKEKCEKRCELEKLLPRDDPVIDGARLVSGCYVILSRVFLFSICAYT